MKIFTIEGNEVFDGAVVEKSPKFNNPVVAVGKKDKYCKQVFISVGGCRIGDVIYTAEIGQTGSGREKLLAGRHVNNEECVLFLKTDLNKDGSNLHYGEFEDDRFPGRIIERGVVSKNKGETFGDQLIVIMPKGEMFSISGYSDEAFMFDGNTVVKQKEIIHQANKYLDEGVMMSGKGIAHFFN